MPSVDSPSSQANKEADKLAQNDDYRRVINQSLGAVLGRQTTESFFALTYEELAEAQIKRISDKGTDVRPSELERVDRVEGDLLSVIGQIRKMPPEAFLLKDSTRDVNTAVDPPADV
jgi:hypothetical protein